MNQYIITEKRLQEIYEHCDWGMTNFQKFKNKLRPYQGIFRNDEEFENTIMGK